MAYRFRPVVFNILPGTRNRFKLSQLFVVHWRAAGRLPDIYAKIYSRGKMPDMTEVIPEL